MDGYKDASGIIVLAATNRADILDKALTRSGRFDRKITLEVPSYADRVQVALVHLRPLQLCLSSTESNSSDGGGGSSPNTAYTSRQTYAETIAALTPGCSGADLFNICNESAIQAARDNAKAVSLKHVHRAVERVLVGLERSAVTYTPHEKERIAYHEAGVVVLN
uniref:AFG3-like protein 1 n=1 Tax=Lygus hesperus TaxID=30085 RepID=A0A0A9WB93_LYGHE